MHKRNYIIYYINIFFYVTMCQCAKMPYIIRFFSPQSATHERHTKNKVVLKTMSEKYFDTKSHVKRKSFLKKAVFSN